MKRPLDPRHHGLKEPEQHIKQDHIINLSRIEIHGEGYARKVSLKAVAAAWDKALKEHELQGHHVTDGPYLDQSLQIRYTVEWDNQNYAAEKNQYDVEVALYASELSKWQAWADEEKKKIPSLDDKIEKTKKRLANLEATRDGKPLPYPDNGHDRV